MPKYDYQCPRCEIISEIERSITAEGAVICETCNTELIRIYTPVGVTFKGSGFYKTDSRGK